MKTRIWLRRGIVLAGAVFVLVVGLINGCDTPTIPRIPPIQDTTSDTAKTG